jgi:hypothetical protein
MMVHFSDLNNLDDLGVFVFPKLLVCLDCGSARFKATDTELALLASSSGSKQPPDPVEKYRRKQL